MAFNFLDWIIIFFFIIITIAISLYFRKSAGKSLSDFFLGGRNLPWYVAGISMVATTFAADTPLAVTEIVANQGISGNWVWWSLLTGGLLTTFFFANLWRRANILTEVELIDIRYSGLEAKILRLFKSVYLGLFLNVIVIGWVNLAMATILQVFFGLDEITSYFYCGGLMLLVAIYSSLSGLLGVAYTDVIQFIIAMIATITLAIMVIGSPDIGCIDSLKNMLPEESLSFFPSVGDNAEGGTTNMYQIGIWSFIAFFGMVWWTSWYPGAEPGGGGYVAQRMMSAKDEKNAIFATLFFQIGHYCIRPWPWILVALSAVVIYSLPNKIEDPQLIGQVLQLKNQYQIDDKTLSIDDKNFQKLLNSESVNPQLIEHVAEVQAVRESIKNQAKTNSGLNDAVAYQIDARKGFVFAIRDYLPNGLLGLLFVAFLAAYMSTISTQLNWGASYLVNDFYQPLFGKKDSDRRLVSISRIATFILMVIGFGVLFLLDSISGAWVFIMECGAGLGLVLILRWYWWRINAWSEIIATIAPFIFYALGRYVLNIEFPNSFFFTVAGTTISWLIVTFITPPTKKEKLESFYQRVRPQGAWQPVVNSLGIAKPKSSILFLLICWLSAVSMVYSSLFFIGKLIFAEWTSAGIFLAVALVSFLILRTAMQKAGLFSAYGFDRED